MNAFCLIDIICYIAYVLLSFTPRQNHILCKDILRAPLSYSRTGVRVLYDHPASYLHNKQQPAQQLGARLGGFTLNTLIQMLHTNTEME